MRRGVAIAGLVLFAAVGWPLFERVENAVNVPLTAGLDRLPLTVVRILPERTETGAGRTHSTWLRTEDAARVLGHGEIRLLVGTFGTRPDLDRAELAFDGTRCVYRTPPGASFPNNGTLDLRRADGCMPLEGTPTGRFQLTVSLGNHARLALWAHAVPHVSVTSGTMVVDLPSELAGPEAFVVSGRLVDEGTPSARQRRVELLAYMWQVASGAWWIWLAAATGSFVIAIGFLGLWSPSSAATAISNALERGASAFLVTAGLGLLYAVLTPPFQAPDEPHHFVAFAEVAGRPELVPQIQAWTELAHVTRIRFRPAEQFTPSDIGHPAAIPDPWYAPASTIRGGGVHLLWRAVAPVLRPLAAPAVFLSLRLVHALFLAALVGCSVAVIVLYADVPSPRLLAFPILLVPTLPFFGMHVSNHAPVIGAYVLLAAGVTLLFLSRKRDEYVSGLLVGLGWAMAIGLSRSAMPLAALVAAVAGARLLFGPAECRFRSSALFWAGLVLPVALVLSMSSSTYLGTNARLGGGMLPAALLTIVQAVARGPWLLSLAVPVLAGLECGLCRLRRSTGQSLSGGARMVTRWAAVAAAGVVAVLMTGSLFFRYPVLATIDPANRPTAAEYARDALSAGLTILRLAAPDYRTSVTFWGGFGWLETLPSDWLVSLLTGATGVALIGLLVHIARTSDTRRFFIIAAAVAGFAAGLAAYALSLSQVEVAIDLAGRYLFGLYIALVMICWSGLGLIPGGPARRALQSGVSLGCVLACTGIHVYCLRLILYRYF